MYDVDNDWLTERIMLTEPLTRALGVNFGGLVQRVVALHELAEQFGLDVERLGGGGYFVLDRVLEELGPAMDLGPWSFTDESYRHKTVAEAAVHGMPVDDVLDAMCQFGWQRQPVDGGEAGEMKEVIRCVLAKRLGQKLIKAFERWNKSGVWTSDMALRGEALRRH